MSTSSTNNVSSALLAAMNPASTSTTSSAAAAQNQFMTLLVTQMQNQDPLNPMDNSQMTSQLAQLSTVSGIDTLNTTLQSLMSSSQTSQAASMIGHGVFTPGNTMTLASGTASFGVNVTTASGDVKVSIQNSGGQTVDTIDLGKQSVGTVPLTWDGKTSSGTTAPDGNYTFTVTATTNGQNTSGASGLAYGEVSSVSTSSSGTTLNVNNIGTVNMSDVVQIF